MLLRISLIVAILAGSATLYFSHVQVADKITNLTTDLQTSHSNEQKAKEAETKAKADSKKAKDELDKTSKELADKSTALDATAAKLGEQQKRADQLAEDLTTTQKQRNEAQQGLAAFTATGVKVEEIIRQRDLLAKAAGERDTYIAENKILNRNILQLKNELARYVGPVDQETPLPPGLKGKILAVDPKYNFVVLNIGEKQGVLENGKLLVNRDGKLIAKVRITKVEPERSIANVIPEWQQSEIMEGDQVLY